MGQIQIGIENKNYPFENLICVNTNFKYFVRFN